MPKFKTLYLPLLVSVAMLNIGNLHGSAALAASSNEDGARTTSYASSSPIITVLPSDSGGIVTKIMDGKDISQTIVVPLNANDRARSSVLGATFNELGVPELLPIMAKYEAPLRVYVLRDKMVSDIDLATGSRVDIPVGIDPTSPTLVGTNLYVVNTSSDSVSVIDTTNNTRVGGDIEVGREPYSATLVGTHLYVVNTCSHSVSVIDTTTNTRACADIGVGSSPIPATLVRTHLYVYNRFSGGVSVIDTTTKTRLGAGKSPIYTDIQVGRSPASAALAFLVGTHLYVVKTRSDRVSVIDTTTNTRVGGDIEVGIGPRSANTIAGNLLITCSDGLYLMHLDRLQAQLRAATTVTASSTSSSCYK
jgi:YVTN family beta-propeller protein